MRPHILTASVLLSLAAAAATQAKFQFAPPRATDGNGKFVVTGSCPGDNPYRGTVTVMQTTPVRQINWIVEGATAEGMGLDEGGVISVSFETSTGERGLAIMRRTMGGGYEGSWAYSNSTALCHETWTAAPVPTPARSGSRKPR